MLETFRTGWISEYSEPGDLLNRVAFKTESFSDSTADAVQNEPASVHYVPGELLVQFATGVDAAAMHALVSRVGGRIEEHVRGAGEAGAGAGALARISLGTGITAEKAIEILSKLPGVAYAEPNFIYTKQVLSDDPGYTLGYLWGMYGDRTDPASQYGSQAGEAWAAGWTGSAKVAVGVIDTGIDYTHPDLYLNIWINPGEIPLLLRDSLTDVDGDTIITFRDLNDQANAQFVRDINQNGRIDGGDLLNDSNWENRVDEDANGYVDDLIGWDFYSGDNDPYDDDGHGTHVAGTIAATGGNGAGVAGVGWATQLIPLKFLGPYGGTTAASVKAVDYFTAASMASSVTTFAATNNSWGGGGYSQSLLDSIVNGAKADILFVAAAGNGGRDWIGDDNDAYANYPSNYDTTAGAGYDAVIAVASITSSGELSSFSNYGLNTVDIAAPGTSIDSTVPGGYATFSGTSMATPHVTGAIALYAARNGSASASEIRQDLLGTSAYTASLAGMVLTGGRLDAYGLAANAAPVLLYGSDAADVLVGGTQADSLYGLDGDDQLESLSGNDVLDGGLGADRMIGGSGNDTYRVDNAGDAIVENAGGGVDRVFSTVSYVLSAGAEMEILAARYGKSTEALNLTGNEFGQKIFGNAGPNLLSGGGGRDALLGRDGDDILDGGEDADTLDGGLGTDRMVGGTGNDIYRVDNAGDVVVEAAGAGADRVFSTDSYVLPAGAEIEILAARYGKSTEALDLTGNEFGQKIYGNAGANLLSGGGGRDALLGRGGDDVLQGGEGNDSLNGGDGNDLFVFSGSDPGNDTVLDFLSGSDKIDLRTYGISKDQVTSTTGTNGTVLHVDSNRDGFADFTITLNGAAAPLDSDYLF